MNKRSMITIVGVATLAIGAMFSVSWAGPPAPPVVAQVPRVPVGGFEVSLATAAGIAAYGLWRARK